MMKKFVFLSTIDKNMQFVIELKKLYADLSNKLSEELIYAEILYAYIAFIG